MNNFPICKTCKDSENLVTTAGYWYCTRCTGDEVIEPLTVNSLDNHVKETFQTLKKELKEAEKEVMRAEEKVNIINSTIAKFETQALLAQWRKI